MENRQASGRKPLEQKKEKGIETQESFIPAMLPLWPPPAAQVGHIVGSAWTTPRAASDSTAINTTIFQRGNRNRSSDLTLYERPSIIIFTSASTSYTATRGPSPFSPLTSGHQIFPIVEPYEPGSEIPPAQHSETSTRKSLDSDRTP